MQSVISSENTGNNPALAQMHSRLKQKRVSLLLKRGFDILASLAGLILLCPLFLVLMLLVMLDSGLPVFYRQPRVGLNGKTFLILKFRTMVQGADREGLLLTTCGDSRITRIGAFLRRYKLDELPQLVNVLLGQMSFVGPRPVVERYVRMYSDLQRNVLLVRPGITDYASIAYVREEEMLAGVEDPEAVYIREIMPAKLELNMAYMEDISVLKDIQIIFKTFASIIK